MEFKSAELAGYIKLVCYGPNSTESIFGSCPTIQPPTLRNDCMNRILFHRGCYNPPHCGHKALLHHVYDNTQDINVIAAIIDPVDDQGLEKKYGSGAVLFSKEQRIRLWCGYQQPEWCWIYEDNVNRFFGTFDQFSVALSNAAARDGFGLQFVILLGPDHVTTKFAPLDGHEEIIVGDVTRAADFVTKRGDPLLQLPSYEPWKSVEVDEDQARRRAGDYAAFLEARMSQFVPVAYQALIQKNPECFDRIAETRYAEEVAKTRAVSICHCVAYDNHTIRFIPASPDGRVSETSATEVRNAIARGMKGVEEGMVHALREAIEPFALHPDMLVEFCLETARHTSTAAMDAWHEARRMQEKERVLLSALSHRPSHQWPGPLKKELDKGDALGHGLSLSLVDFLPSYGRPSPLARRLKREHALRSISRDNTTAVEAEGVD